MSPNSGAVGWPYFELESNGVEIGVSIPALVNDGQVHHLVGTWSGSSGGAVTPSQFTLYLDGTAMSAAQITNGSATAPLSGLGGTKIGRSDASGTNLNGTVDDVAIYNSVLPAARVAAHHTAGSGYQAAVLADAPVAYYPLDDGAVGTNAGPNAIVSTTQYVQNDSVSASASSAAGAYLLDVPAFTDVEDSSGNRYQCTYTGYDGQPFTTGQTAGLTAGSPTIQDRYTGCGDASGNGRVGQIRTTHAYDAFGNAVGASDGDANAGVGGHLGCTLGSTSYSACTTFGQTYEVLPLSSTNALGQTATTGYLPAGLGDSSGHGGAAALWSGSPAFGAPGLVSGDADAAVAFDGASAMAQLPAAPFGAYPTSGSTSAYSATFEAWFSTTSGGVILGQTSNTLPPGAPNGWAPALYVDSAGALRESLLYHGSATAQNVAPGPYNDGKPHHVVATYAGGTDTLYVDGQQVASLSAPETGYSGGYAYLLGTGYTTSWPGTPGGWNPFSGTLDEVAVYGSALPAARVAAHFAAGAGYRAAVLADGPAAYYRMDEAAPAALPAADASGHGAQATASSGVTFGAAGLVSGEGSPAASFNGATGLVAAPAQAALQGDHARSIELWLETSSGTQQSFFDSGGTGANGQSLTMALTQQNGVGGSPSQNTPGLYLAFWGVDDVYLPGLNLADGH
ncbi:MAG TPA: LamG-like jellyroll fold domain-containing protein, partial [Candidatus Dormibacteraeota bacterium]|nr:LamG-like jellyroll fold domain-containing protein [Candidatus Dormibacteraeota bacterium]